MLSHLRSWHDCLLPSIVRSSRPIPVHYSGGSRRLDSLLSNLRIPLLIRWYSLVESYNRIRNTNPRTFGSDRSRSNAGIIIKLRLDRSGLRSSQMVWNSANLRWRDKVDEISTKLFRLIYEIWGWKLWCNKVWIRLDLNFF